jgi:hypothetical protein
MSEFAKSFFVKNAAKTDAEAYIDKVVRLDLQM